MEKNISQPDTFRLAASSRIRYSEVRGFETGNSHLNEAANEFYRIFKRLARIPSNTKAGLRDIVQVIADMYTTPELQSTGVTVTMYPDGPVEIIIPEFGNTNKPPRLFAGHLDIVKGTPSNPEIAEGVMKSHGPAIDNKGPVAAMIVATQFIIKNNISHPKLRLVFTGDEETDGQQIKLIPIGDETMAFIVDKSGPIGTIVTGSGGYAGISATVDGLTDEKALEFLRRLDRRMGNNMIARRGKMSLPLPEVFRDKEFSIDEIRIGPNNSRNTVADSGSIIGTFSCRNCGEKARIHTNLSALLAPVGASVQIRQGDTQDGYIFEIDLHGKAGHTSKVGTSEDDGFVSVFSDALALVRSRVENITDSSIAPSDEVRINIGSMSGVRRGGDMDISLLGEARYHNGEDANMVLEDLQHLVEEYGGTMDIVGENGAYQVDTSSESAQLAREVLQRTGYKVQFVSRGFGISDANNAPIQWKTVVLSDGSINPHRSDEAISLESVIGLLQVFYDLATQ